MSSYFEYICSHEFIIFPFSLLYFSVRIDKFSFAVPLSFFEHSYKMTSILVADPSISIYFWIFELALLYLSMRKYSPGNSINGISIPIKQSNSSVVFKFDFFEIYIYSVNFNIILWILDYFIQSQGLQLFPWFYW